MSVSKNEISSAEKVFGIKYTDAERHMMLDNIETQIISAKTRRKVNFPKSAQPALKFDPRPAGFVMPLFERGEDIAEIPFCFPTSSEEIAFAPLRKLASWIKSKEISCLELTKIYLQRIASHNNKLKAYITVTEESALKRAVEMDTLIADGEYLGPLHGIPYGLKDIFDTKGILTTWGAEPWATNVPEKDSFVAQRLKEAGAILLGKTSVGALAYGDVWLGEKTKNPWNVDEGSSGSSAGSASATAAGLCAFSIGTETLGSITSPSERCGTVGLRPTFGRIPRTGCMPLCPSLDKIGPICRYVDDSGLILEVLNQFDPMDRGSIDAPFIYSNKLIEKKIRIGYLEDDFGDAKEDIFNRNAAQKIFSLAHEKKPIKLSDFPFECLIATLYAEAAASFEDITLGDTDDTLTRQDSGAWPNAFRKARFLSAVDHVQLDRLRMVAIDEMNAIFEDVDFIIGPMAVNSMLIVSNFTGHPCLQIPVGFEELATRDELSLASGKLELGAPSDHGEKHLVPRGISILGPLFQEDKLLNLGKDIEGLFEFFKNKPPNFS